jgi:hypothetical protein
MNDLNVLRNKYILDFLSDILYIIPILGYCVSFFRWKGKDRIPTPLGLLVELVSYLAYIV